MARLGNPLVYDLLEVADTLATQRGRKNLRKASMRRAVSSAYYAVFHALCFVCASQLIGWSKANDLLEPVYRMLDHGSAKNRLTGEEAAAMPPAILEIGARFKDLAEARRVVDLIEALPSEDRLKLAILLVTKAR